MEAELRDDIRKHVCQMYPECISPIIVGYVSFIEYEIEKDDYVSMNWKGLLTSGTSWIRGTMVNFQPTAAKSYNLFTKEDEDCSWHTTTLEDIIVSLESKKDSDYQRLTKKQIYDFIKGASWIDDEHPILEFSRKSIAYFVRSIGYQDQVDKIYNLKPVIKELKEVLSIGRCHGVTYHWM